MIQFIYSSTGISNPAVYLDSHYSGSTVKLYLTSSFSGDETAITGEIISNKTKPDGGWVLLEVDRENLPTKSGQYDVNIYAREGEGTGGDTWIEATSKWTEVTQTWLEYSPGEEIGALLAEDRAVISGSDYDSSYKYEFEDESNFTVYYG